MAAGGLTYAIYRGVNNHKEYQRKFNPDKVEEIEGTVIDITEDRRKNEEKSGLMLILETKKGHIIPVHLGPKWFLLHQHMKIKEGNKVKAIGSRMDKEDNAEMVASKILSGISKLVLRDDDGTPRWQSWFK